jgi:hypothetical protein
MRPLTFFSAYVETNVKTNPQIARETCIYLIVLEDIKKDDSGVISETLTRFQWKTLAASRSSMKP